jgi:hypothetical protein
MRPGAFAEQPALASEDSGYKDFIAQSSVSAPPSPGGVSSQLWPNANEPCPSSPKSSAIRTSLQKSIKKMKGERMSWTGHSHSWDTCSVLSPPMRSPWLSPKPAAVNSQESNGTDEREECSESNLLSLARCDSQSDADGVAALFKPEDGHSRPTKQGEPAIASERSAGGEIPILSRSPSQDRSTSLERSVTGSPVSEVTHVKTEPGCDDEGNMVDVETKNLSIGAYISHMWKQQQLQGPQGSSWQREDTSWKRADDVDADGSNILEDSLGNFNKDSDESDVSDETMAILSKDVERIRGLSFLAERQRDTLGIHSARTDVASVGGGLSPAGHSPSSSGRPPKPPRPEGRDVSTLSCAEDQAKILQNLAEELAALRQAAAHLDRAEEESDSRGMSFKWVGSRVSCSQQSPGSKAGDTATVDGEAISSDTPLPSWSKDLDEWRTSGTSEARSEAEDDDVFCMSISSCASLHRQVSRESFTESLDSPVSNASPAGTIRRIIHSDSCSSINSYAEECIGSVVYQHQYKLCVRVMQVFKRHVQERRIFYLLVASRREKARRDCMAAWCYFAEMERQNYCTLAFVWRAWLLSFQASARILEMAVSNRKRNEIRHTLYAWRVLMMEFQASARILEMAVPNRIQNVKRHALHAWRVLAMECQASARILEMAVSNRIRSTKRRTLQAWLVLAIEQWADSFRKEKAMVAYLRAWSDMAERNKHGRGAACSTIRDWRQWHEQHALFELWSVAAAARARLRTLLDMWADATVAMRSDATLLRCVLCAWRSRQEEVKAGMANIKASHNLRACCDVVSEWSELISDRKIEVVYNSIIQEVLWEEAELAIEILPQVVNFRAKVSRRCKTQLLSWREHVKKIKRFNVQHERSNFHRLFKFFNLWLLAGQVSRSNKLQLMNPHTSIEVSQGMPSPRQLLRDAHGDVEEARLRQKNMQVSLIQRMLSRWVSGATAGDLLEHANGNTERALEAARDAEFMGLALQHFAQATQSVVLKRWTLAVERAKTRTHNAMTVRQQADLRAHWTCFGSWRARLQHKDTLWHAQLAIQEKHTYRNSSVHFRAWADMANKAKRFASEHASLHQENLKRRVISLWRTGSLQSLCFFTSLEIIRTGWVSALRSQTIAVWAHHAVVMRKKRELCRLVCSRHENVLLVFSFTCWKAWNCVTKHHQRCFLTIKERWHLQESHGVLFKVYHTWSHEVEEHQVNRVLAMLNSYEADIQPHIRPLVSKCLEQSRGALGLKWSVIGSQRPKTGEELKNPKLAEALDRNLVFTRAEFQGFGVTSLSRTSYIQAGTPDNIKFLRPVGASVQHVEMLINGVMLRERAQHISELFHEDIGVDTATLLLERSNGNVDEAVQHAYEGAKRAIATAYYIGSALSGALEALKDFVYMFRAWRLLMRRAEMLPAKFCFLQWVSQASYQKSRNTKMVMLASAKQIGRLRTFFAAWWAVCDYYLGLAESEKYLCNKAAVDAFYLWQLSIDHVQRHRALLASLVKIMNVWRRIDFWNTWKARWILWKLYRSIRLRHLKCTAMQAFNAWLWVRSGHVSCLCIWSCMARALVFFMLMGSHF